ncbi:MAG: DNA polymerase III subunit alpha [Deltaproteobacteria bacterium]|nr:DNA polymerase III subunit alpha [Deltaproteobacteria bacterium]
MPTDAYSFVHLHVRTEYSLLRSMIRISDLIQKAKELQMPAVAIADYMTLSGAIKFYVEARRADIKPIIGCEVEVAPDDPNDSESESHRLVLLCEDTVGYSNLCRLLTRASTVEEDGSAMVRKEMVAKHDQGLIALSGWMEGEIPRHLMRGEAEEAKKAAYHYKEVFGDRFYLELISGGLPVEDQINRRLIELGKELGIPVVAAGFCHYLDQGDAFAHHILFCIRTSGTLSEHPVADPDLATGYYFRSPAEMEVVFSDCPEALANTLEIADRCNLELDLEYFHLPRFETDPQKPSAEIFKEQVENGFKARRAELEMTDPRFLDRENEYRSQLEQEKSVILDHKSADYFLIVADYMNWARDNGIPVGPGRGSATGSLVNYCLGITDVNPLAHGLIFDKFLSPERPIFPDIDVDVCMIRRDEVIDYIYHKYGGPDHVAQILTFGTMKARAAVRDVGRVLEMPYEEVDRMAKLIPPHCDLTRAQQEETELRNLRAGDEKVNTLFSVAEKLEGIVRHRSTHAAGIVVSDKPLSDYVPVDLSGQWEESVVQYDMKDIERLGLVKFDILGLKTLAMLGYCVEEIRGAKGVELHLSRLPLDDSKTYELLCEGNTQGVFQFESEGMKDVLRRMRPDKFSDLAAVMALYRPGPLSDGIVDRVIARKNGQEQFHYAVPQLAPILDETYGAWVYMEQVLRAFMELAGMSFIAAGALRMKLLKRILESLPLERKFVDGAVKNGIDEGKAEDILSEISFALPYTYNKAHAVAYSVIAYQCAFLKANYPDEFRQAKERMEALG